MQFGTATHSTPVFSCSHNYLQTKKHPFLSACIKAMEETRVSSASSFHINSKIGVPWMLTNRLELLSSHWLKRSNGDALLLSYVSIIQKCLHPLIVFLNFVTLASLYYITAWTKKDYAITKEERSSPIIVKFAVIKLRGGFKPHFCHTRPCVPILDLSVKDWHLNGVEKIIAF